MKKYYDPQTKKQHDDLFEELNPVFTVCCTNDNIVNGDKGCAVYINLEAKDEEDAMNKAIRHKEFMSHIHDKKNFNKKYLSVYKPTGIYVIGVVKYYEGDPRL